MMSPMQLKCRSGYVALLSVLLVSAIAATTVLILFVTSLNTTLNSSSLVQGKAARTLAESCVELALQYVTDNISDPCTTYCGTTVSMANLGMCTIKNIEDLGSGTSWRIRTTGSGTMNITTHYLEIDAFRPDTGNPQTGSAAIITDWKECINFDGAPVATTPCTAL